MAIGYGHRLFRQHRILVCFTVPGPPSVTVGPDMPSVLEDGSDNLVFRFLARTAGPLTINFSAGTATRRRGCRYP